MMTDKGHNSPTYYTIRIFATRTANVPEDEHEARPPLETTTFATSTATDALLREIMQSNFRRLLRPVEAVNERQNTRNVARNVDRGKPAPNEEVAERFEKRRRILRTACGRYGNSSAFRPRKLRILRSFRYPPVINVTVGYCPIEKTSSTTWRGIFSSIRRTMNERRMTAEEVKLPANQRDVLFTFVREPYSRLLSAYVDKIFSPNTMFWTITGRYVVQNFRQKASKHSLQCGHDVTFPEFIKYFIHMQKTGRKRNGHYIPIHDQCRMCNFPYKFIGHLETIKEDMPFIMTAIQSPVSYDKVFDNATIVGNARMALRRMRTKVLKCISLDEASRRLWKKWQIRGVIHKSQDFPLTKRDTMNVSDTKLSQMAIAALGRSGPRNERVVQKKEAMREAFASVPLQDRLKVQRLLFLDFQMFGFDPQPDEVFPKEPFKPDPNFSYFDLHSF